MPNEPLYAVASPRHSQQAQKEMLRSLLYLAGSASKHFHNMVRTSDDHSFLFSEMITAAAEDEPMPCEPLFAVRSAPAPCFHSG